MENEFAIDLANLHLELAKQPDLVKDYGDKMADAKKEYDKAKDNVKLVYADLDSRIRLNPSKYGVDDIKEKAIESAIIRHKRYREAQEHMLDCKRTVDVLDSALTSLDHKKKSLEALTSLWIGQYWSVPKTPSGTREEMKEESKRTFRNKTRKGKQ